MASIAHCLPYNRHELYNPEYFIFFNEMFFPDKEHGSDVPVAQSMERKEFPIAQL